MYSSPCVRVLAAFALSCFVGTTTWADEPPGVLWQTTSQMVMPGMPMTPPPNTLKLCTPKVWTQPPPGRESCVNSNYQRDGDRATWEFSCSGQMPMTGTGEMTFEGTDSYTGAMNATVEGMAMTIKLSGTKIGTCDNPISS